MSAGQPAMHQPRFLDAGEAALVVEFGSTVDPALNDRVLALDEALVSATPKGVLEMVPTFRSLMIHYDPLVISREQLVQFVSGLDMGAAAQFKATPHAQARQCWHVPCCYALPHGEDLAEVAASLSLTQEAVVRLHSAARYRLFMYGFAPGFAYLGGLPDELGLARRAAPRAPHPENAVMIAGGMSLITTFAMPTGWWVIGRTAERMFAPGRKPEFLANVGDEIRFEPVDAAAFALLEQRAAAGEPVARRDTGI
jgi:inhibitor of KinA